ncbi:MAG: radical SAM family heme chaperone HemW [Planctomycetota bacterium]|jgi:oxygen-independent coproporphyrinogen-3 oxidase
MRHRMLLEDWGWSEAAPAPLSAYIHVPFCAQRCGYCNFSLLANRSDLFARYLSALEIELRAILEPRPVRTLFLGGGTPSILPLDLTERMLALLAAWLPLRGDACEWSIEANPIDITRERLALWKSFGIDRVSLGGQSFDRRKLATLERDHSPEQLMSAIDLAKQTMRSVSLDLIFAAPGETFEVWSRDIAKAIACDVDHLSTYGLTYEKGAKFWGLRSRNQLQSLSEEDELQMYAYAIDTLASSGFEHYEISNFAKPAHACRHNQTYWQGESWWAFGPSAARYVGDVRSVNHRSTLTYLRRIESGQSPVDEREVLTVSQKIRERFVFGMRQIAGIDWPELSGQADAETRDAIAAKIAEHIEAGWMQRDGDRVRLTQTGLFLSDSLWPDYL